MPNWKKLITSGSSASLSSLTVTNNVVATAFTGSFNIPDSSTLGIGSQTFFPQGTNGFSVNEDFDPSNSSLQTAYHFTSGTGRETVAFTLARTGQFTDGFGIYGTNTNNTFVMFGEQNNTSFEWRRGVGIRPLDLDGGTLLAKLSSSGDFDVSGSITVGGTVNGVDISTLNSTVSSINTQVPAIYDNAGTPALNTGITEAEIKTLLNLEIGTDVQAYDADLTTLGGLAKTDGNFIVGDGTNWVVESGATARTSIGLGTANDVQFDSIGIGTAAPGTTGVIRATNDIVAYYSSDERLKDNISEIPNALEKVESLRGVEFDWNDEQEVYSGHDIGVIAQEVEAVLPELVQTRDNGYKAVKYEKLTAVLIQAVKELSARVKELESKQF